MSDNKPPMTVWIGTNQASPTMENTGEQFGYYRTVCRGPLIQSGPYVHLEQFMEEVEYRTCRRRFPSALSTLEAMSLAMQELAKEIMEGNG
jgi:hypothetical protein